MKAWWIFFACVAAGRGSEAAPPPTLNVPRVEQAVILDGQGGDPAWSRAVRVELRDFWSEPDKPPAARTCVSLLHDGETLYVAFDCEDADVRASRREHDDQTFRDDCVEIFFGAAEERLADTVGIEINALGTVADYFYRHADWINYRYESGARVAVSRKPRLDGVSGYRVEVAVSLGRLEAALVRMDAKSGKARRLRTNFARWDRGAGGDRFSIWSDTLYPFPHPHRPERYGWLMLE